MVAMLVVASTVYGFITNPPPFVDIHLPLSFVLPKLPLTWAAVIALAGIAFIVFEGGYRLRQTEQAQGLQDKKAAEEAYETLQQRLHNLSIEFVSVKAVESLCPKDTPGRKADHRVFIDFILRVRNGDGQNTSTVELVACTSDLRGNGECDRLGFEVEVHDHVVERSLVYRTIPPGTIRQVAARAVYDLPVSDSCVPATRLKGSLTLKDNRGVMLPLSFTADLEKKVANQGAQG